MRRLGGLFRGLTKNISFKVWLMKHWQSNWLANRSIAADLEGGRACFFHGEAKKLMDRVTKLKG